MNPEESAGDFVQGPNQAFQIDELPSPALRHLFKFLNCNDQKRIRQLCKGMQYFLDKEYGIHAYFPLKNFRLPQRSNLNLETKSSKLITDSMLTQAIENLKGKVVRSLEMYEMPPDYNPFPFEKFLHYPWGLLRVSLKYVDVSLLITLLSSCRNLLEFRYETGVHRVFFIQEIIQPVPIPSEHEELIEILTLPHPTFQVDKLTFLSLRLERVYLNGHSDWANVVFLLLSLSQRTLGSLKNFKFHFDHRPRLSSKNHLQILACIGQFLAQCPNLCKLAYSSCKLWIEWNDNDLDWGEGNHNRFEGQRLPENVLSFLIQKYGSTLLKEVNGTEETMLMPIRQIMKEAGKILRSLQDVSLGWRCRFEPELFQILLTSPSPSIRIIDISDQTGLSFTGGSYNLLLAQTQTPKSVQPVYRNLEKLCVYRIPKLRNASGEEEDADNVPFSLPRMLNRMRALRHFQFLIRASYNTYEVTELEEHEPDYQLYEERNDFETPDVTFEEVWDVHFQHLQVLVLHGVKMSMQNTARLIQLRNLKELVLYVLPEHRHQLFGISSGDLIRLVGTLRKLEKLSVNMILFPEDETLKSPQLAALQEIGSLKQMRRPVGRRVDFHEYVFYGTEPMVQYKFNFCYDNAVATLVCI